MHIDIDAPDEEAAKEKVLAAFGDKASEIEFVSIEMKVGQIRIGNLKSTVANIGSGSITIGGVSGGKKK